MGAAFRHEGMFAHPVVEIKPVGTLTVGIYRLEHTQE